MTRRTKRKLIVSAMFLLPILIVKITAMMLGAHPESAAAEAPPAPEEPAVVLDRRWTERQLAAAAYVRSAKRQSFGPSPFFYVVPDREGPIEDPNRRFEINARLQMVMTGSAGDIALIDGRRFRVGDVLPQTDWVIEQIDVDAASVVLRHRGANRTVRLSARD